MRLRISISEPYDLVAGKGEVDILGYEVSEGSKAEQLVVKADQGSRIGRRVIDRIVFQPRHVGRSLDELKLGRAVIVHGTLYPKGWRRPLGFIGIARAL